MNEFALYITISICLIMIIEGLLYALFTDSVRKVMASILEMPEEKVKAIGYIMSAIGFIVLGMVLSIIG